MIGHDDGGPLQRRLTGGGGGVGGGEGVGWHEDGPLVKRGQKVESAPILSGIRYTYMTR
jgi:hypothetical protein